MDRSEQLFARAQQVMPGGVNSPVRAFRAVGCTPVFMRSAAGCRITDEDGRTYLDYIGSWGPMILGHADPGVTRAVEEAARRGLSFGAATAAEVEMAELITQNVPHVEMIRMVNSGTEAVMSALRVARGFTHRSKVLKFAGCYHGHCDAMLVRSGSGTLTFGAPDSAGVPAGAAADTLVARYNDLDSVQQLLDANRGEVACVIVEPVAANMGVVPPAPGFLAGLRRLCDESGALLIFDEVITGFRLAFGGAAQFYGVRPDLVTYGKIIGGGMPVGAYGGRRDIMQCVSPCGSVYQAGTLAGNPVAMAAGIATLRRLLAHPEYYAQLEESGRLLAAGLRAACGCTVNAVGSLCCVFMTHAPVRDFESAMTSDTKKYAVYFRSLLEQGISVAPAQFEAMFLGICHTRQDLDETLRAARIAAAAAHTAE